MAAEPDPDEPEPAEVEPDPVGLDPVEPPPEALLLLLLLPLLPVALEAPGPGVAAGAEVPAAPEDPPVLPGVPDPRLLEGTALVPGLPAAAGSRKNHVPVTQSAGVAADTTYPSCQPTTADTDRGGPSCRQAMAVFVVDRMVRLAPVGRTAGRVVVQSRSDTETPR